MEGGEHCSGAASVLKGDVCVFSDNSRSDGAFVGFYGKQVLLIKRQQ